MSDLPNYEQDSKIQFVIDAVFAFAHALDALKADICPTWKGICPAMIKYDGGEFYKKYLLKVDFEGETVFQLLLKRSLWFIMREAYLASNSKSFRSKVPKLGLIKSISKDRLNLNYEFCLDRK